MDLYESIWHSMHTHTHPQQVAFKLLAARSLYMHNVHFSKWSTSLPASTLPCPTSFWHIYRLWFRAKLCENCWKRRKRRKIPKIIFQFVLNVMHLTLELLCIEYEAKGAVFSSRFSSIQWLADTRPFGGELQNTLTSNAIIFARHAHTHTHTLVQDNDSRRKVWTTVIIVTLETRT